MLCSIKSERILNSIKIQKESNVTNAVFNKIRKNNKINWNRFNVFVKDVYN